MSPAHEATALSAPQDDQRDLTRLLRRHVVSLHRQPHGKRPVLVGTASLLSALGCQFLVTAGHVLREPEGVFFYVGERTRRVLSGRLMRTQGTPHAPTDPWDIAVLLLKGHGLPPYPDMDKDSADTDLFVDGPRAVLADDIFLVTGMPASRARANPHARQLKVEACSLAVPLAPPATYEALGLDPEKHLVLALDRQESLGMDGSPRVFPDPHGMSGSPVWRLPSEMNGLSSIQLVGVLTEFHENLRALVATRVGPMLELMGLAFNAVTRPEDARR